MIAAAWLCGMDEKALSVFAQRSVQARKPQFTAAQTESVRAGALGSRFLPEMPYILLARW